MKNYITEDIFLLDDNLYYKDKKITESDWHKKLIDCGWQKLNINWIKKLNKLNDKKKRNSLFGELDCGSDGECLFNCISHALNDSDIYDDFYDSKILREKLSERITNDKYNEIIEIYRILKDSNDFDESWNPYDMTYSKFIKLVKKGGDNFWADSFLINILMEYLNINIIILTNDTINNIYDKYPNIKDYESNKNTIILIYEDNFHFKLLGYFDNKMISLFNDKTIPKEIKCLMI